MPPPERDDAVDDPAVTVTSHTLRRWPLPPPGSDKESRGRTLLVGGHEQTPGAILLAAEAALRSGAGKLQVATVASMAAHIAIAVPEALVRPLPQTDAGDISPDAADAVLELADGCASVLLGPGMGDVDVCVELLSRVVPSLSGFVVLDAAAHAYVGAEPDALRHLDGQVVLTPNRTELALTLHVERDEVEDDPAGHALRLARRVGAVVSCGGSSSWIAAPDGRLWCDESGNAGLGVSGSGDVLAGTVTGLAARGAEPAQAALWAAHVHGRAGDHLAASVGPLGYLAREVAAEIPRVLTEIAQ